MKASKAAANRSRLIVERGSMRASLGQRHFLTCGTFGGMLVSITLLCGSYIECAGGHGEQCLVPATPPAPSAAVESRNYCRARVRGTLGTALGRILRGKPLPRQHIPQLQAVALGQVLFDIPGVHCA